ncbi:MAG: YbbC/YhhH family protein [Chryseobacterium sp.]|nr:NTF2 fold immunity protein [Chryseobacterium sp.]MCJ7936189.1 YbbC/YhhH family protein [Chryseobacterium sp.]
MKNVFLILSIFSLFASCKSLNKSDMTNKPMNNSNINTIDYVPNEETAVKIAQAVWYSIYGNKIDHFLPYKAVLVNNVWIVNGTLHDRKGVFHILKFKKKMVRF